METYIFIPFEKAIASTKGESNSEKSLEELALKWRADAAAQFDSPEDRAKGKVPKIIYYDPSDPKLNFLGDKNLDDYKVYIFAHGQYYDSSITNVRTMGNAEVQKITAKELSARLVQSGLPKEIKNLNLYLCNSGRVNPAGTSIAKEVSQELMNVGFDKVAIKGYYQPVRADLKDKHKQYYNPETQASGRPSSVSVTFKAGVEQNNLRVGCGLLNVIDTPDTLNFSSIQHLIKNNNAILLIEDKLYYADYESSKLSLISERNAQDYLSIKDSCKSDYQYVDDESLSAINRLTGKVHLTSVETGEKRIIPAPLTITQIKSYDDALAVLGIPLDDIIEAMNGPESTTAVLRRVKDSYFTLAKTHHSDKGGDAEQFKSIKNASELLNKIFAPEKYLDMSRMDFEQASLILKHSSEKIKELITTQPNFNIRQKKHELDLLAEHIISSKAQEKKEESLLSNYKRKLTKFSELAPEQLINVRDASGDAAVHREVNKNAPDAAEIKRIKDNGGDLNILNFAGDSALHLAAKKNNINIIEALSQQGADFDKRDSNGQTVFQTIVVTNKDLSKIEKTLGALKEGGADPQPALAYLMILESLMSKPLDKIEQLKKQGVFFDFTNQEIQQSLIILVQNKKVDRITDIKKIAGDAFTLNGSQYTDFVCNVIKAKDVERLTLSQKFGFIYDLSDPKIKETIKNALQNEDVEVLEVFKRGTFKFTDKDFSKDDVDFLTLAIWREDVDLFEALKKSGVNLNHAREIPGISNFTPLISSILLNKNTSVQTLLKLNVNKDPLIVNLNEMDAEQFATAIAEHVPEANRADVHKAVLVFIGKNKQLDDTVLISPHELGKLIQNQPIMMDKSKEDTQSYRKELLLGRREHVPQFTEELPQAPRRRNSI